MPSVQSVAARQTDGRGRKRNDGEGIRPKVRRCMISQEKSGQVSQFLECGGSRLDEDWDRAPGTLPIRLSAKVQSRLKLAAMTNCPVRSAQSRVWYQPFHSFVPRGREHGLVVCTLIVVPFVDQT